MSRGGSQLGGTVPGALTQPLPGTDGLHEDNPFALPSDEEIFMLQEVERQQRTQLMATMRSLPVHMKSTFSSQIQATVVREVGLEHPIRKAEPKKRLIAAAPPAAPASTRRPQEKENMNDFIAKKREIFLVQMSLDTKRAEITKLEERALQREEALKKSEQMLEEDALRFDAFLKENDEKVQEAIKKAEVEAKAKQDKLMEIKRVNALMATIRSQLNKYEEQVEECRRYQKFLDSVTPVEWQEQQRQALLARQNQRHAAWLLDCEALKKQKQDAKGAKARAEQEFASARTQQEAERAEQAIKDTAAALKEIMRLKEPPAPAPGVEQEEEGPMYFQDPRTLLQIYAQLEEQNLFLIQNAQESEEALEELRAKFRSTKERMDGESEGLRRQVARLELTIQAEMEKGKVLQERAQQNFEVSMGISAHEVTLDQLADEIAEVYERCGFDRDATVTTLQMLTNIETRLEEYLTLADVLPLDMVENTEKSREKDRRQVTREEKILQQKEEHESRVKRALERAAAPVFKKTGKPVMFRSQPTHKKTVQVLTENEDDDSDLQQFLAKDMLAA
ncbi:hypothetical protein WJX79_002798 [Trebouxia sp. C0005]